MDIGELVGRPRLLEDGASGEVGDGEVATGGGGLQGEGVGGGVGVCLQVGDPGRRVGGGADDGRRAIAGGVGAIGSGGEGAVEDEGVGLVVLVAGDAVRTEDFEGVGGIEVVPLAKGFLLAGEEGVVGDLGLIDGVEVEHGPGDVAFVVFPGFELAVDALAVLVDIGGRDVGHLVGEVVPLGGLVVGDLGEGEIATGSIDAGTGGEQVVEVAAGVAAVGAQALRPGVFGVDAVVVAVEVEGNGWVLFGWQIEPVAAVDATDAVILIVDAGVHGVTGGAVAHGGVGGVGLGKGVEEGLAAEARKDLGVGGQCEHE